MIQCVAAAVATSLLSSCVTDPVEQVRPAGSPSFPIRSVYDVQALADFDSLDGVVMDPATSTLSLFGHRASPDRFVRIAYLDHLAAAMESTLPRFSLEWTPDSKGKLAPALRAGFKELGELLKHPFDKDRKLTRGGAWFFSAGGARVEQGMDQLDTLARLLDSKGQEDALPLMMNLKALWAAIENRQEVTDPLIGLLQTLKLDKRFKEALRRCRNTDQAVEEIAPALLEGICGCLQISSAPYLSEYRTLRSKQQFVGSALGAAVISVYNDLGDHLKRLWEELFKAQAVLHVPPDIVRDVMGFAPQVEPVFKGDLAGESLLGLVSLEADVLLKSLLEMPELRKTLPDYRTMTEFEYERGGSGSDEGHVWLSPDGFVVAESPRGQERSSIWFKATPVRVNIEKYEGTGPGRTSVQTPILTEYAALLTSQFNRLAREFAILHEIRECMKAVVVASWLKSRGYQIRAPRAGRAVWSPPKELPGAVYMAVSDSTGKRYDVWGQALGGIDYRAKDGWHAEPGLVDVPNDDSIRTSPHRLSKNPRRSEIPGWNGRTRQGDRRFLTIQLEPLDEPSTPGNDKDPKRQLKAAESYGIKVMNGIKAMNMKDEQAAGDAMRVFDKAGQAGDQSDAVVAVPEGKRAWHDPVVPPERHNPAIDARIKDREEMKKEYEKLEAELDEIRKAPSSPDRDMKLFHVKDRENQVETAINAENFFITDDLGTAPAVPAGNPQEKKQ